MSLSSVDLSTLRSFQSAYGQRNSVQQKDFDKNEATFQKTEKVSSFEDSLQKGLSKVNELQIRAEKTMQAMVTGDVDDISEVAAAVSEADMALRFAVQVRDKLLDGYNQLIRMSV